MALIRFKYQFLPFAVIAFYCCYIDLEIRPSRFEQFKRLWERFHSEDENNRILKVLEGIEERYTTGGQIWVELV